MRKKLSNLEKRIASLEIKTAQKMTFSIKDFFSKKTKPLETLNLLKKFFLEKLYGSMEQKKKKIIQFSEASFRAKLLKSCKPWVLTNQITITEPITERESLVVTPKKLSSDVVRSLQLY